MAHIDIGCVADICGDADGNFICTDLQSHTLKKISSEGDILWSVGSFGSGEKEFRYPTGLSMSPDGTIWVADRWNHRVQQFDCQGRFLRSLGQLGIGAEEFCEPWFMCHRGSQELLVVDRGNHRIHIIHTETGSWHCFGGPGPGVEYYENRAFKNGSLYQRWFAQLNRFHTIDHQFYLRRCALGCLNYPQGIAVDKNSNIYVSDTLNRKIRVFHPEGLFDRSIDVTPMLPDNRFYPQKLCCQDRQLWVASDTAAYLLMIDLDTMSQGTAITTKLDGVTSFCFDRHQRLCLGSFWKKRLYYDELLSPKY